MTEAERLGIEVMYVIMFGYGTLFGWILCLSYQEIKRRLS